jgi:SWI/SNF-related matrix-associated actin-dependent regulator 1 of chromatin subfamily A
LKQQEDLDVIVTTYNMATTAGDDRKFLKKMDFQACIFDEGHQLKNAESKKYKDLMEIKVRWRCLLTGTPLQNNLQELVVSVSCSNVLSFSSFS